MLWELVSRWHTLLPAMSETLGGSGYYYIITDVSGAHVFIGITFFVGSTHHNGTDVTSFYEPLVSWAESKLSWASPELVVTTIEVFPKVSYLFDKSLTGSDSGQGKTNILGSRLLSKSLLSTPSGVSKIVAQFKSISTLGESFNVIIGHIVAGGAVSTNKVDSALLPAWRKALVHIVITHGWKEGTSFAEQARIKRLMTFEMVPRLKALDWDTVGRRQTMGAYLNEADKEEVGWRDSFWGDNYARLRRVKDRWDGKGVFWCRPCVGSEDWDREGVCRIYVRE